MIRRVGSQWRCRWDGGGGGGGRGGGGVVFGCATFARGLEWDKQVGGC